MSNSTSTLTLRTNTVSIRGSIASESLAASDSWERSCISGARGPCTSARRACIGWTGGICTEGGDGALHVVTAADEATRGSEGGSIPALGPGGGARGGGGGGGGPAHATAASQTGGAETSVVLRQKLCSGEQ